MCVRDGVQGRHTGTVSGVGAAVWVGVHRFRNLPVIIAT